MNLQATPPSNSIEQLVDRILSSRRITRRDQARFMATFMAKEALSSSEQAQIDRIFDGLRSGLLKVVD